MVPLDLPKEDHVASVLWQLSHRGPKNLPDYRAFWIRVVVRVIHCLLVNCAYISRIVAIYCDSRSSVNYALFAFYFWEVKWELIFSRFCIRVNYCPFNPCENIKIAIGPISAKYM